MSAAAATLDIAILLAPATPFILPPDNSSNLNYIPVTWQWGGLAQGRP
jgi:hypothetical protein